MTNRIPEKLRQQIAQRANFRCEYCRVPENFLATFFHVDHVRSVKHGGLTEFSNLAYSCPHCNQHKGSDVATFLNEDDEQTVRFFNPRKDRWQDHFELIGGEITSLSTIGAATVSIFNFNQAERVILRQALLVIGQYIVD